MLSIPRLGTLVPMFLISWSMLTICEPTAAWAEESSESVSAQSESADANQAAGAAQDDGRTSATGSSADKSNAGNGNGNGSGKSDSKYPPYDEDDVAVLDGSRPGQLNRPLAITNRPGSHSYIEIAHLTIRNYGHDAPRGDDVVIRGAFAPAADGAVSHIYLHDVAMQSINEATHTDGHGHVVYFWIGNQTRFTWFAFQNNLVDRFTGYGFRGVACNGSG